MFPIKTLTFFNLVTNLSIVAMTIMDRRAGMLMVALLFMFEHGQTLIKRRKRNRANKENGYVK